MGEGEAGYGSVRRSGGVSRLKESWTKFSSGTGGRRSPRSGEIT
jgi:hypothetical protein